MEPLANVLMHDSALFLFLIVYHSLSLRFFFSSSLSICLLFILYLNFLLLFLHSLFVNTFARIELGMWIEDVLF